MLLVELLYCIALLAATAHGRTCQPDQPRQDCGHVSTQEQCKSLGCCWNPKDNQPSCFFKSGDRVNPMCNPSISHVDCGRENITKEKCEGYGCCWESQKSRGFCYFPSPTYLVQTVANTTTGVKITLKLSSSNTTASGGAGAPISPLTLEVWQETEERLHFKISDPNNHRWEVPERYLPVPPAPSSPPSFTLYDYEVAPIGKPFFFAVTRKGNKEVLFNSLDVGTFYFSNQYLSIGTQLPKDYNLYGLGEHKANLKLRAHSYTLWNYKVPPPPYVNLYGSHPFYLDLRSDGSAHGVFLRNSNGMDVIIDDLPRSALTYRVIGGVLDFYVFAGPSPEAVIQQYHEVIGRPHMPPYWSLGYHQCRFGYSDLQEVINVVNNFTTNMIPLDTAWIDIDYMDNYQDFTVGKNFPLEKLQAFVAQLHNNGQHFVVIIDPGIHNDPSYEPYSYGLSQDIFIKDRNNKLFIGKAWPGNTVYPDFLNPNAHKYWQHEIEGFLKLVPGDGLWLDQNEPGSFCNGACPNSPSSTSSAKKTDEPEFNPNDPPYLINNQNTKEVLNTKTLDMDAIQYEGQPHYNAHNIYGLTEAIATQNALESLRPNVRSFVLSRSTFAGSGAHAAHWTGDNSATFGDMYMTLPVLLSFQLFGVTLVGTDICGFKGPTSEELCGRWMQLGSFYTFARNHNTRKDPSQEPFRWDSVAKTSRKYLGIRYSLLPYFYTLFYKAHRPVDKTQPPGATVMRPLFFEFPTDKNTYSIDQQFMIGRFLLISPQLQEGGRSVEAYFPSGKWYEWDTMSVTSNGGTETKTISTPMDYMPIHVRGGSVLAMQPGTALNTTASRRLNFALLAFLDGSLEATGDVYLDDGVSLDMKDYTYVEYTITKGSLTNQVFGSGYASKAHLPPLSHVTITPVSRPSTVTVNGEQVTSFSYNSSTQSLQVTSLNIMMDSKLAMYWS